MQRFSKHSGFLNPRDHHQEPCEGWAAELDSWQWLWASVCKTQNETGRAQRRQSHLKSFDWRNLHT